MAEYKIKDLESLTGIKAHTIRMWEKRYSLLEPCRTDTNVRTYSDEDLQTILLVSVLVNSGLKISFIAEMTPEERSSRVQKLYNKSLENSSVEQLVLSLLRLDETLFNSVFDDLVKEKGMEVAFSHYVIPFLDKIGIMWLVGTINPAQEHFVAHLIRQKIIASIDKVRMKVENPERRAVLYLPEHEWHELGLLFYHYILKEEGWKVFYLGQSVPLDALEAIVKQIQPDFLVTSWVVNADDNALDEHVRKVREFYSGVLAIGGKQVMEKGKKDFLVIQNHEDLHRIISDLK